jgi:DNA-binding NarL/FixJ family response regulator
MTELEREVIRLLDDGFVNNEIGKKLHVSTNTVKSHIHNIIEKIALHQRLEAANDASSKQIVKMVERSISTISN